MPTRHGEPAPDELAGANASSDRTRYEAAFDDVGFEQRGDHDGEEDYQLRVSVVSW